MYPELLGVIKSYGLLLALSFALGLWLSLGRGRRRGISPEAITDLVFAVLVASIVGVRLMYVMTHLSEFRPWYRAFFIWDGGLTLYGGIGLATLTVWWLCRRQGLRFLDVADVFSPGVALGIGLTRVGCFLAGCCFGRPSECSFAVRFPEDAPATIRFGSVSVHPTQLYGAAAGFLVFGALLLLERRPAPRGATFWRFLLLYGVARFVEDAYRYYEPEQVTAFGWSNNQWISAVLVLVGLLALVRAHLPTKAGEDG